MVLTSPIAGKAKFHFSKINVGSVMSVMFVDIRPGALGSPESTEVHGNVLSIQSDVLEGH